MAIRFISVADARVVSGIDVTLIDDPDMTDLIEDVEYQIERYLNTSYTPVEEIDVLDGNARNLIFTRRGPLLGVRSLESNDVSLSVSNLYYKKSGQIILVNSAETSVFTSVREGVVIKYLYGTVEWDRLTSTSTDAASIAGTSIALSVLDETGFAIGDFIEIFGTDKHREVAKITATGTDEITVDQLSQTHSSGSIIHLMVVPSIIKRLMKIAVGIAAVTRAVGQSYDDIVGYTMGEFQVQKGEPYTQFRETINQLVSEKKDILSKVRPFPAILT